MAKWYIKRNDKQSGPFESAQLKQLAVDGKIKPNDQIRRDDQETWHKAESVKGLFLAPKQTKDVPSEAMRQADASQPSNAETKSDNPTSSGRWFIGRNGKEAGPFEMQQLVAFAASGRIKVDDLVRKDGESLTKKASELRELFQATSVEPAMRDEPPMSTEESNDETADSEAVSNPQKTKDWFYQIEGEGIGPVSFEDICHLYKTGKIESNNWIGQAGMRWMNAGIFLEQAVIESASSEDEWFIIGNEQNTGPYPLSHLQGLFKNNELTEGSLIGRRGSKGLPVIDFIPVGSGSFYDRLLSYLQTQTDGQLRGLSGCIGFLCFVLFWLLWGVPLWIAATVGFGGAWLAALLLEKFFDFRMTDSPILFASLLVVSLFLTAYRLPEGIAEGGLLNPSGPKYSAFKALVNSYKSTPRGNVTANQLYRQLDAVRQAQEKFIKIPFDPVANPREAKKIADLYMRELYGRYDGELHQDLYSDHLTPIIDAVKGDVEIPWNVRRSWGLGR